MTRIDDGEDTSLTVNQFAVSHAKRGMGRTNFKIQFLGNFRFLVIIFPIVLRLGHLTSAVLSVSNLVLWARIQRCRPCMVYCSTRISSVCGRGVQLASCPVVLNVRDLPTSPDRSSRVIRVCTYIFACRATWKMLALYRRIEMTNAEVQHLANTSFARTKNLTYTVNSQTELELKLLRTETLWQN